MWSCLLYDIFHLVSDLVISTGFQLIIEYSSKLLHLPIRPQQPVSRLISTTSFKYTSHHELSTPQVSNFSNYHA